MCTGPVSPLHDAPLGVPPSLSPPLLYLWFLSRWLDACPTSLLHSAVNKGCLLCNQRASGFFLEMTSSRSLESSDDVTRSPPNDVFPKLCSLTPRCVYYICTLYSIHCRGYYVFNEARSTHKRTYQASRLWYKRFSFSLVLFFRQRRRRFCAQKLPKLFLLSVCRIEKLAANL